MVLRCKITNTTTSTPAILAASDATIRDTTLAGIGGDGMLLGDRAVVERVRVRNVGGVGIRAGSDAIIDGVQMSITSGDGIVTGAGSRIEGNTVRGNPVGIELNSTANSLVIRNYAENNTINYSNVDQPIVSPLMLGTASPWANLDQ